MTPSHLRAGLLASIAGLALCTAALARPPYYNNGPVGTTPASGGYCDTAGCPDHFWRYPIHYGSVFYGGRWYSGPVYYRGEWRDRQYWVRGGWHRDEWRWPRPGWTNNAHDGPALPFEFYASHGFRITDRMRRMHDDERFWDRGGWDRGGPPPGMPGGPPPPPPPDWNRDHGGDWHGGPGGGDWNRNGGGRDNNSGPPDNNNGRGGPPDNNNGRGGPDNGRGDDRGANNGGPPQQDNVIHVTGATYGGQTCHTAAGNVTHFLADACNGKKTCDYVVQYQTIGDPAPGCAKDFNVQWTCLVGPGGSVNLPAEAGLGSHAALRCDNNGH